MSLFEILTSFEPRQALAVTTAISVVLYALMANLAWLNRQPGIGRWGRLVEWSHTAWTARLLGELVRWLYYLAVPYSTLILGYNTVRALGVWWLDWQEPLTRFILLGVGAVVVTIWVWRPYARDQHPHAVDESGWNWARHIVELVYQQAHWAFYRSGPILWLGDFYWGSFFGLALVFIEGWSNPTVRANARDVTRADAPLWSGSLAVITTIVFIATQNTWYCVLIHLLIDLGLRKTIGFPRVHTPSEIPPID